MLSILLYTPALYTTASRELWPAPPHRHLQDWSQGVPTMKRRKEIKQSYGFSSNHVWLWELDYKRGWVLKNWSFSIVVLEKTLESRLDSKEIKPVNPKGDQPLIFIGRTEAETEDHTLATWCEEMTQWKRLWCWEKNEGKRRMGQQRVRWFDSIPSSMELNLSKLQET